MSSYTCEGVHEKCSLPMKVSEAVGLRVWADTGHCHDLKSILMSQRKNMVILESGRCK